MSGKDPTALSAPVATDEVDPRPRRRGIDLSALVTLVLGVPLMALSLLVVAAAAAAVGQSYIGWTVLAWLLSGVATAVPFTEGVIALLMLRLRRATESERVYLEIAWGGVLAAAGVPKNKYRLWVERSDGVNAYATGGHIVAVTRRAMATCSPRQLEAVLAHELGHHLGGHAWASLLTYWYSIPIRLVWWCLRCVTRVVLAIVSIFSTVGYLVGLLLVGFASVSWVTSALHARNVFIQFVMLGPILAPAVVAWFGRRAELAADRTATRLGYGPDLIELFQQWQREGQDEAIRRSGWRRRMFATHPLAATRISAIEKLLARSPTTLKGAHHG